MKSFGLLLTTVLLIVAAESDEPDLSVAKEDVKYTAPKLSGNAYLAETFDSGFGSRWVKSEAKKEDSDESIAKYNGEWEVKEADSSSVKGDVALVLTSKARHAAISAKLDRPFTFSGKPFVVQYEVKFQNGMDCGGAYVKLLSDTPGLDLKQVTDKTGYTIMFGPDACGMDKKMHFIMRHKSPKTGQYEEKHAKKPSGSLDFFSDKKTHLFRLTVRPNNEWEVHVDGAMLNSGGLLEDMTPPINPPAEIDDPSDSKPADWDEREKIPDPTATKPIDWDEDAPEFVVDQDAVKPDGWLDDEEELTADPSAVKPQDWDDEMDGEWEAPKIENPKCKSAPGCGEWKRPNKRNPDFKGKWKADLIDNPNYKGVWKPKRIANPDFFEDKEPYKMTPIGAVAFELWTMTEGVLFDNILITDDEKVADSWAQDTWYIKRDVELAAAAKDSPSLTSQFWQAMDDKPWLWAALIVAMLVPIGVVVFCCMGSGKDAVAERKKTDAPTADDTVKEEEQKESAAEDNDTADDQETKEKTEDDGSGDSPAETKKSQSRSTTPSRAGRQALNEPAEDEGENSLDENSRSAAEQSDGEAAVRRSPRKRNVRKD